MPKYDWRLVGHTINGYDEAGSFDACANALRLVESHMGAGRPLPELSTKTLRIALFFAARADRHRWFTPEECPVEEAIVAELIRRLGEEWLERESTRVKGGG